MEISVAKPLLSVYCSLFHVNCFVFKLFMLNELEKRIVIDLVLLIFLYR